MTYDLLTKIKVYSKSRMKRLSWTIIAALHRVKAVSRWWQEAKSHLLIKRIYIELLIQATRSSNLVQLLQLMIPQEHHQKKQ